LSHSLHTHTFRVALVSTFLFFFIRPPPLISTLFPYTTLFRSTCSAATSGTASTCSWATAARTTPSCPTASAAGQLGVVLAAVARSEEHTSELQSLRHLVCRLLLEKKKSKPPPNLQLHRSSSEP